MAGLKLSDAVGEHFAHPYVGSIEGHAVRAAHHAEGAHCVLSDAAVKMKSCYPVPLYSLVATVLGKLSEATTESPL